MSGVLPLLLPVLSSLAQAALPEPGDPRALVDLRGLARRPVGERFVIDTLSGRDQAQPEGGGFVLCDIAGPGVVDHLMLGQVGEVALIADDREVMRCGPHEAWRPVYPEPEPEERGELPFAFPLVQTAGPYAHCALPISFARRLVVTATEADPKAWIAGRRLDSAASIAFSTDADSPYMTSLSAAHAAHEGPRETLFDYPDDDRRAIECYCGPGQRSILADVGGPAEVVGMHLRIRPGALELLRHQVIEIAIDGNASVRMPLVDFVGVSHPWPHAWQPMAGDRAAGIVHPYSRSGGRLQPAVSVYCKLPIPFREELRIEVRNRSPRFPVNVKGVLQMLPLDGGGAGRLCGTSRRVDLRSSGETELIGPIGPGQLVGLSMFATGHQAGTEWRRMSRTELVTPEHTVAQGAGLLPLAMQGLTGNITYASLLWNHNSLERINRCGAARHFWTDPLPLAADSRLLYVGEGGDGPTRAEVGALWYQDADAPAYTAPEVPDDVAELPPIIHAQPGKPEPGGWMAEAEVLAEAAEASEGEVRAETVGAKDAFASGDAYLAWNARQPGDVLDLWAAMPESRYVRVWLHRLLFGSGGIFALSLAPPEATDPRVRFGKTDADIVASSWGQVRDKASVDYYDIWPHRQAYRFDMPIMLNPAPGRRARIRFSCGGKRVDSRGHLLAVDQLGTDPAPTPPPAWNEIEAAWVSPDATALAAPLMRYGREDFFGWGGREIMADAPGRVALVLTQLAASPVGSRFELRGVVESGEWTAQIDDGPPHPIALAQDEEKATVWSLALQAPRSAPGQFRLAVQCRSSSGRLLLDAWRLSAEP